MNKIFRTVWNHHRRQIVVVNENTTSHSQATGSSETSSVERFSSKTKALVVSALASAVCACFALPAQASWITDHGGSDNRLDWIVGTEGTTTWNPLQNQEFEILQGETLNVGSTGSNHVEFSKYTLPNVTAGNRITNRGTYNIHWVGNKAQAGAENEGNFLDNYGKVNIVFDQTPNFGPDVSQANGNAIHNISAWEVYKWNMDGSDATWLKDKPAFYNREGAEFTIDVNVDATKLTADQDPLKRDKTITGFAIDGENDRAHMVAKNAGKMGIAIENAGAKTYGVWVNFDNSFINEKTGVLEIVTSFKKPASNFLNLDEYSLGLALGGSGSFQNDGTVKVDVEGSRTITAINGAGSSPLTAKFVNSAGATMIGNATTNVGGTALVVGLGANDLFENYGTLTGTALANGGVAQAIGLNNPESMINNYAGATLDLTAKSVYSPESSQKAHAEGIYLNDGEKFLNHGNATLTAIVDGAGTANVMNGWGINATDASKAGTTVSNDGTMVINYTGALGGGIKAETPQLENANQLTINVNRTDAEVIRTDVKGIYVVKGGSLLNTKDLDVVITANVDSKENFDKKFQASGGSASGIFATATDATPVFTNKGHANVQVTLKNNVDGLSSGVRGNGVYLEGNGSNSGTLDIHLDANYGTVTKDFDVFAASGFWLNGDAKRYGTPRFENTGSLNINTNFVADGIQLVEMTGPNSKGWSRGLEIHGQGTFVNNGQLKSVSTGNVITEGLGVQGGEFINNKDAEFVATSDGQYALGALISMPTASFEQVPPTVTNVNGATLTLTATAKNGTSSALYQSAGITTNAGTLLLNSTGKNARGIVLSNYETSLDQNLVPVLNNTGTLTITANSLEDGQPSSLHEVHGILLHKGEVNNSGTITTNVTGDGLVEGLKVTQTMFNNKLGGVLNINSVSNKDVYQDGIAAGVSIGANGNVVNAGELNIDMESHAHFIKGIAFLDRTSQLTNTGSISITGTNHGDGTTVVVPSLSDTKNAYGIYMNKSEQFANDGTVEIAVNSLKGVSMGIGVHDAEFTNNEHGNLNITTKAYEKQAYGIDVYGASGRSNNAGTITFDVTGGTTTSSHATGLLVSNGGFYGNTGTLDFNLHGVTSVDSNAEVLAIDLTRENTKFKNQGRIDITGRRTGDIATSGDLLGIRVNNGAVFENTDAGTISIDLGATGNNKYGNNFAVSVFNASTFGNKGTINITLDQEANNIGTLHGLMLGADAIVNNAASALIKIDVAPEDVASGHVWAINGEGASIRNYGTIETNGAIKVGSIIGSSASLDGGTVKLTGKDAVSTVATELKTGTLENAGTLTVGSKTSPSWAVNVYDLKNTGTLNAGTIFVINSLDNAGVVNVDTTQRIALSTYGKEVASGQHASIVNRESGQLTINVDADPAITSLQAYVAGIDLFGPTNQPTMTGGDFTNLGTATVSIVADRGHTYGIIADSTYESTIRNDNTLTIDVTKSASDATYGTWGIRGNHATSIINNGTLSINGDSTGDGFLQGIALYGSDTKRGSYRNDGLATITLVGNKNLDPSTATNAGAIGLNLSNSDAVNTSEMVFNVDGHRSDAIKLQNGSSLVNSGNITVNTNPSEGMDLALDMIGGSHFTNAEGASFTFNYLSDDPALASASTDGIKLLDEGTVLDNSGNIAINLKHLGERDDAILLKGLVVHTGATLNNAGTIEFSSETNKSASVIDGAMAVNGTLVNNGTVDLDVISHESDRQVWVGNGTLQNKNVLTMTALNDGTGDVVGFMHDWKSVLPEEKTLNITNERVMNLTLTAENGSAILYDMQGKERFENAVGATVNTTVSGGSAAKGWVMGDTSVLVNEGQVDLKLEGLNQNTVLAGVEALGEGVTATNNSTFSLTLAGTGASATGLKGNATGALFTNTGTLTVKNEGQFDQVAGIDWNGKFNNEGVITLDMTRASGESGAVNGLLLGDAFKFENKTNGTLKIDIASQDVAKSDVFAINGEGATIKNLGLIETNGAINVGTIYGDATSPNGGVLKLTGRESVSTVTGQLSLGRIENAGTLTVGTVHALSGPNSGTALKAYDLINTGTLNADTAWFTNTFTNEGEVNISTTTNRIALSTLGKDKSTGEHVTILNKKDGVLNISTKPNESLTADSKHVAGIDLFSSGDLQTSVGGDFINLGTTNIDVESHKGHTYGIVADSSAGGKNSTIRNDGSLTIDVAKLSDDDTTSVRGIHTLSGVSIINNGTLTINASKQDNQRLYGVVLDGSETDRNTFHNTKDMSITLTENGLPSVDKIANEGLYGLHLSYTDAVNTGNLNLNLDGYRAEGIRVRHASTFLNQGAVNVSIKPKDSALLGDVAKQGNNYALQVIEGSTFKNDVNGTITYRYENDNAQLTTAFTDGLAISGEGSEFTNLGSIDIHLKDLGERQASKWMKGILVGSMGTLTNEGNIHLTSETNRATESIDGVIAVNGQLVNRGDMIVNATSHESDRQFLVGSGHLQNQKNLTLTLINDGSGNVAGFNHDWTNCTPDLQTLHVQNEKDMNLTLKALNGTATIFDMVGQERFDNGATGVITAGVSGGAGANGWSLADTSIFANDNEINLTLTGLSDSAKLASLTMLGGEAVATNSGTMNITLAGQGAEAYGLKSTVADALFTNDGVLNIEATGTFTQASGMDWAGTVANAGEINSNVGLKIGTVTGTGTLTVTGGDVSVDQLNDQRQVILTNVGTANFGTIVMKSGSLEVNSKTTIANVTGNTSIKNLTNAGNLTLGGTLTLGASGAPGALNNTGTLTIKGHTTAVGSITNSGRFTAQDMDVQGSVYNRRTGVMQTGTLTVRGDKALTNEGEMTVADNSSVFGTLTNTGSIYLYDKSLVGEDGKIENRDELLVFGSLEVNGLLINLGTSKTQELILNGESISGTSGSFFMADRADVGAESIAQSGQVNGKRTNFGKDYWGTVTVNAVYENHDLVFAGSNDAILDQLGQGLSGTGMTVTAEGSILNQSGATLQINGALDNSGSVTGGTLALDASSQLTNRNTINVDALTGSDITITQGEAGATLTTAKNEVTNSNFILTQGNASFDTLGTGNTYQLGGHVGDSVTVDLGRLTSDSTINIGQGAELAVTTIDLDGVKANTVVLDGGTLKTSLDQIFADVAVNGAVDIDAQSSKDTVNVSGMTVATNVGAIKDAVSTGIAFNSGTVAFTDRVFSLEVTNDVLAKLEADDGGNLEVAFNGKAAGVDAFTVDIANQITATKPNGGSTYAVFTGETLVNKDTTQPGLTHTQLVVGSVDPLGRYTPNKNAHHLTQSMGFKNVTGVTGGLYINDARFVLVGDAKQSIDLADGLVQVIGGEDGLVLGSYGSEVATKGHLAELNLGVFAEQGGYTVAGGATDVHNGDFVVDTLRLGGTLTVGDADRSDKGNAKLTIGSLTGYNGDVHNYGDTTITTIAVADNKSSMQIHNHGKLEIQNGTLEGRLENKVGAKVTTGDVTLAYTESVNDGTWLADALTIAGSKKYIGDMIGRGELLNAGTLTVNKDLTLGSTLLSDDVASGGVLINRSTLKNRPAKLTVNGTLSMDGKSIFVNDGRYASVTANALTMAAGSSFTNQKGGTVSVTEHGQIEGQYKNDATSSFGSLTVTQTGAVTNTGTLTVTGQTELAGSITGSGNVTAGNLTVDATGVLAMTGTGALTAQVVVVNAGGKVSVAGDSQLNALTATNAGELAFGSLAMTGDLSLTGSVMTALLSNAGNVTLANSTLTSKHDVTLGALAMTGSEATLGNATMTGNIDLTGGQLTTGTLTGESLTLRDQASLTAGNTHVASLNATTGTLSLGTLTVDGDITLDASTVTAQLISGGNASLTNGSTFNGTGSKATLNSLSLASGSTMTVDRLAVTNAVNVAGVGSAFTGALTQGGVTTVTDGGQIVSTGATTLDSLTMTDAKDSSFGTLTVNGDVSLTNTNLTANLVKGGATTLTGSQLTSTGMSELASLTLSGASSASFGTLNVAGALSVDGSVLNAQIAHGGATTVSNGGQVLSTGSTTLDSLTMTNAQDSTFGTLTINGGVTLAGTNLTADLLSAGDVLIHQGATIASTGTSHLGSLTMTDAGTSTMGDVTVDGAVSLTNTNLTANLVKGDVTTLTGSTLISTGSSELASLTLNQNSNAQFGKLAVAGALSVDGSVLNGQITHGGATTVSNGGQVQSTGSTTLDSLTMTDAEDSTFGTLTVKGDVTLAGTNLTADLLSANDVLIHQGATIASTGTSHLGSLTMTDAGTSSMGDVTVDGVVSLTNTNLTANLVKGGVTTLTGSQLTSTGVSDLASLTLSGASSASFGTLNVAGVLSVDGSVLNGQIIKGGATEVTNGGQITSTGATTLDSLTMTNAQDSSFGTLTVKGDVALTGSKLTADLRQAGNVSLMNATLTSNGQTIVDSLSLADGSNAKFETLTVNGAMSVAGSVLKGQIAKAGATEVTKDGQIVSTGATTLDSLTMTDAKDSSFGALTVNGDVSLTNTKLIANLVKGGATSLTGSQLTSTGTSELASLALSGASTASFGTLNVTGALSVDGSVLNAQIAHGGATIVTNAGQITSTGSTTLDSLTMTDAKDSTFGTLTVNGNVALTGSKLTADLRQAGNVTLTNATLLSTAKTTMADYSQTGGVGSFGAVTANNVNVTDGAFTTAGLVAQSATFAGKTSQVALNGTTHLGSLTISGTNVSTDALTVTDKLVNDSLLTGSSLTANGADGALVTVNNTGTIRFDTASGKVTYTQSEGELDITKNNFTGSTFDVTGGIVSTDTLGKGNAWTLGGVMDSSVTMNINTLTSDSTVSIKDGATLETSIIALNGKANTVVLDGGTLSTMIDQIFTDVRKDEGIDIEAGKPGDIVDVEGLNAVVGVGAIKDSVSAGIAFNSGTVAFNDKVYSLTLATDVLNKLEADDGGNLEVVFNGRANVNQFTVDLANTIKATNDGKPAHAVFAGETLINIDKTQPDLHHSKLVVGSADPSVSDAHHLTQSMGFMNVTGVQDGLFIRGEGTEFVLVGVDANAQGVGDVHNFKLADGDVDVGTGSTLTLGSYGKTLGTEGVLGLVTNEGTVNIKNGLFTLNELTGNGTLAVSDADHAKVAATLKVGTLTQHHVNNFGSIIAETMTVDTLANAGDVKATTLTLNGKGSTSSGKIEAKTATIADAASLTLMGSWVGDTLTVDGTLSMTDKAASMDVGTLTVNTNAQVTSAGTFNVDDLVVNGHLTQSGTATHKTVTVADLAELTNNGSLTTNTLTVEGTYAGSGVLTVNTNTTVTGSLTSTGAKANLGTLTVTDATLVAKDLTSNDATVNGQSSVTVDRWTAKDVMLEGTTTVSGAFTADALTAKSELTAGATTVAGAFVQTAGNATLGSLSSGTFESNGIVNVDKTLNTSKLTQKGGELTVGGALTATAVTLDGVTTIMGGLTADSLNTSNALTAGITTLTGAFVQTAGNATLGSLSSGTFESNGIVNVDKTLNTSKLTQKGGELTVGGALTATAVTLDGVTTIKGGLTADSLNTSNALTAGITTLTGAFVQTAGNATLSSLSSGTFESNGIVNVNKTLNTTTLNQKGGELHVGGTLTATNATFNGTVESGDIHAQSVTTSGSLSASDATIEGIFDQTDGTVTLEDLTAGSVNQTTGQMTASNVTADKVTLGGKTDVAGLTAGQLTVSGTFEADVVTVTGKYDQSAGTADIGALTSESFANAGDVTVDVIDTALNNMGDLTINKTFELSGTNDGTLNADHAKGTLTDFTNNGMAQFGSTTVTDLTNNGSINFADATLNGVNVNNKDMTSNALTVAGTLTTTGTLTSQKTNVDGTLSVNGGQAQLGELGVTGTLNVAQGGVANLGATTVNKGHVNVAGGKLQVESLTQTGGSLSLTQGGSFEGKLNITGADITLGNASLNADGSIKDSNLTITGGTWGDDLTNLVSTDKGALGNNTLTMTGGTLDLGDNTLTSSGSITMTGGTLIADNIALDGKTEGVITVGGKGTLQTTLNQIFKDFVVEGVEISATNWEDAWGGVHGQVIDAATDVGDVKDSIITGIHFNGGSLTFTDEAFRTDLVAEVGSALAQTFGDGKVNVEFTGHAVDDFTLDTIHKLEQDGMADKTQGLVFAGDDLINNSGDTTLDVGKADSDDIHMNTGFAGVTNTDHINIKDDLEFVLVGKTDKDGKPLKDQLLSDATNGGSVHVENGTLTLGSNGMKDKTGGTLAEVVLDEQGNLVIKNGDFTVDRIESDGTLHVTGGGSLTSNEVTLDKGDNKIDEGGVLIVEEDEKGNGSLHIKGEGTLTNDGTLIAGGDNSHVDTTVDGTLTNNGTGVYDDMTINPDGHYHNTSTGKDKGDKIEVAEGGKWTNDGQSSWGQVDNNGSFDNTGSIVIGDGKAETDDFHVGQNGTVNQDGKLDASNAGHTIIEGNFTTGDLTEDGKPDPDAGTKFDDVTVTGGAHLENNGTEIGNNLTVDKDGEYVNNGQSQWGSVDMNGTMDNTGSIVIGDGKTETDDFHVGPDATVNQDGILDASNAGHTIIEGNFTTGDLTEDGKPDPNAGTKFDDVTVTGGAHLENNGTEIGNNLTVDKDGEYVNNGQSQWGTVDIAGKGENNGDLIIKGDGNDATGDLIIEGTGDLVNNGNLIVGGKDTNNDVIIDGTLTNNGTGVYDDMIINPDGHYNNTTTGKDQGDKIEVTEGGKWTNDGQSNWGQVDINGNASNNGDLIIGNGNDKDDDFHIGPNGSLDNQGHIDASNSGTAQIEGDLVNGTLSPDGKPDTDTSIKFDDVVVENGGKLENNGTESGDSLVVKPGGDYINNGNSNWNDVTIEDGANSSNNGKLDIENDFVVDGDFNNNGSINAGNTIIGGNFDQTDNGSLNTGDLTVRPGGNIDMDKGEINVSGDLNLNGANVVIGNWKALSQENRVSPTWSADKPIDGKIWVIGNGDLTFGTASEGFADKLQKFDKKVPGLSGAASRVTVGQTVTMGAGSSLAVGSNVWNPAKDQGRVELTEGSVYFGRDSYVLIDIGALGDGPAFTTTVEGATATVESGANLVFGNLSKTGEFTLLEGFEIEGNFDKDGNWTGGWDGEDMYIVNEDGSGLDYFITINVDKDKDRVNANVTVADIATVYPNIVLPGLGNEALKDCQSGKDSSFICSIVKNENLTVAEKTQIINSVAQIASVAGTTASAFADMGMATDVLESRLSFTGPTHKNGQLLQIPATDALWVEVIGGKSKTTSLNYTKLSGGYKSDTYGFMIGADALMPKPAVKLGGAFSYLSGSLKSVGGGLETSNSYDTYGAHLYAAWTPTTKFNLIGHMDWMHQESDVNMTIGQSGFNSASAIPKVNVAQVGVRAEVRETAGLFEIVPHVGVRGVYTKTENFKTKIDGKNAFGNELEDTFTVQLPIGLTVSGNIPANTGWTVSPKADVTFVGQVGDTEQKTVVSGTSMSATDTVSGAFAGECYGQVKMGLKLSNPKADTSFGGTVGYTRGDAGKKDLSFGVQFTKNF